MRRRRLTVLLVALTIGLATPAAAFDPKEIWQKGTFIWSGEAGAGNQENLQGHVNQTDLDLWFAGVRLSYVPFGAAGPGPLYGAVEIGLQGLYLNYYDPVDAYYAGLGLVGRYNFLSLGRFAPYLEGGAFAGATDLKVIEMDSNFAFLLFAGAGASLFVTERTALYVGYRLIHLSNGNTDTPNRGFEVHTGVVGVSFFFR